MWTASVSENERHFPKIISEEIRAQLAQQTGRETPDMVVACVGGGSNSIGAFFRFLDDPHVRLIGVEAGGLGTGGKIMRHVLLLENLAVLPEYRKE